MEAQVAPSQQLAATQSQKPTTQPCDPTNDPTGQVEAGADEASEDEEEVRRAISALPPSSIARRGFSQPPRATPGAARDARARLFPRTAVPFLTLFPLSPGSTTTVRAAPAVVPLHRGAPELRHIHDGHQGARLGGRAPLARASMPVASPPRARLETRRGFFFALDARRRASFFFKVKNEKSRPLGSRDAPRGRRRAQRAPRLTHALTRSCFLAHHLMCLDANASHVRSSRRNAARAGTPR